MPGSRRPAAPAPPRSTARPLARRIANWPRAHALVAFVGQNSIWIYLWHIPVVLVTARTGDEERVESFEAGAGGRGQGTVEGFAGTDCSLQFTCVNAMAFADIDEDDMSQATSFSATAQQLALSIGVGIGVQVLNISLWARGATVLQNLDFTIAFLVVGLISLSSWYSFRLLSPDAGSSVSGHRLALAHQGPAPAGH